MRLQSYVRVAPQISFNAVPINYYLNVAPLVLSVRHVCMGCKLMIVGNIMCNNGLLGYNVPDYSSTG